MATVIQSLNDYAFVQYSDTTLILSAPHCPKCGKNKNVFHMSRGMLATLDPRSPWGCNDCHVWFRIPTESHIVLPDDKFKRI